MRATTVAALTPVLPALATFVAGATKVRHSGKRLRCYRAEPALTTSEAVTAAMKTLLSEGYTVRVYEGTTIYYPTLVGDTVVYEPRSTKRERDYTCVEVEL